MLNMVFNKKATALITVPLESLYLSHPEFTVPSLAKRKKLVEAEFIKSAQEFTGKFAANNLETFRLDIVTFINDLHSCLDNIKKINHFNKKIIASLNFPLESQYAVDIIVNVLSVDKKEKRKEKEESNEDAEVEELEIEEKELLDSEYIKGEKEFTVKFNANNIRELRIGITSFIDNLELCLDTIEKFGHSKTCQNDGGTHSSSNSS